MAQWHGLAKLRLHTDYTLVHLESVTKELGGQLRLFQRKTCAAYKTGELPRETAARKRRQAKAKSKSKSKPNALPAGIPVEAIKATKSEGKKRIKLFNLNTYKTHALGDYADTIRRYGTTDSYSTELVSHLIFIQPINNA